ncbi:MAG: leucyl aminopeptidase [Candidatus Hydrothermarchaeota archaeon]
MKVSVEVGKVDEFPSGATVLGLFKGEHLEPAIEGLDKALGGRIRRVLESREFEGKNNQLAAIHTTIPPERLLLVGLGKRADFSLERARQAAGKASVRARRMGARTVAMTLLGDGAGVASGDIARGVVEGSLLALYRYERYKTEREDAKKVEELKLLVDRERLREVEGSAAEGEALAGAANFAREIANSPGNEGTPTRLAEVAQELAGEWGLKCEVLERADMERLGMGALLGVAQGSQQPPKLIVLEHWGEGEPIVVVGKAITFDSGGISIKPSEKMEEMKFDKAGGCAVLGIMRAASALRIPHRVIGIIPATENLPGGRAYKPGDILTSSTGKTIEVISTDAEGRLILADALAYAARYKPRAIIDLATLTGACVTALGNHASGMLGNDEALKAKVKRAGEATGERVWELPLWEEYQEQIKSDVADMKNVGGREAGAITAAAFLSRYVGDTPWVHLDIAGTAWTTKDLPYTPRGATGVGVRLVARLLKDL